MRHDAGDLYLEQVQIAGETVVVSAKKPLVERLADRMVLHTEQLISARGGNAWELLQKAPGVSVSGQDAVIVRNSAARILINNKLQLLSAEQVAEWLKTIPSENILRIEVITNPPASYGAEGGSLVNIVLRKDNRYGWNGVLRGSYQQNTFGKYRAGIDFNYRGSKLNIYGTYSFRYGKHLNSDVNSQTFSLAGGRQLTFQQNQERFYKPLNNRFRVGADYFLGKKDVIGIIAEQNFADSRSDFNIRSTVSGNPALVDSSFFTRHEENGNNTYGAYNINYKKHFNADKLVMNTDLDYARFADRTSAVNTSWFYDNTGAEKRNREIFSMQARQQINIYTARLDFTYSPAGPTRFEFGAKHSTIKTDNQLYFSVWNHVLQQFGNDTSRSNTFLYNEQVNALYFSVHSAKGKWKYQAGIRGEHTYTSANSVTLASKVKRNFFRVFPTAYVLYAPKEGYSYSFSIGNRINRPGYSFLNPFRFYSSPYSYIQGNPFLQPSFTYKAEAGATIRSNYNISLYYNYVTGMFTQLTYQDTQTRVTSYSRANLDKSNSVGIVLGAVNNIFSWWQSNIGMNIWRDQQRSRYLGSSFDYRKISFSFNISESFVINEQRKLRGELSFNYISPFIDGLYWSARSRYRLDAGLRQVILRGRADWAINATDLLRSKIDRQEVNYLDQRVTGKQYYDDRGI
ncbi:MAG: TonB-dependent receptor, partial [Dinghuibacter sp.]|nr:TonB-dependent receptor [Dinghuibacter sp.]